MNVIQELNFNPWKKLAEDYRKEAIRLRDILDSYEVIISDKDHNVEKTYDLYNEYRVALEISRFIDAEREYLIENERKNKMEKIDNKSDVENFFY